MSALAGWPDTKINVVTSAEVLTGPQKTTHVTAHGTVTVTVLFDYS